MSKLNWVLADSSTNPCCCGVCELDETLASAYTVNLLNPAGNSIVVVRNAPGYSNAYPLGGTAPGIPNPCSWRSNESPTPGNAGALLDGSRATGWALEVYRWHEEINPDTGLTVIFRGGDSDFCNQDVLISEPIGTYCNGTYSVS